MHNPTPIRPSDVARGAVQAAYFGFVDMFEVYPPIAVLAPGHVYFVPAGLRGGSPPSSTWSWLSH
jgi:hypothetical protein